MEEKLIGKVTHFFGKIMVAGIEITDDKISVGGKIHVKGATTDFEMTIGSMQIDKNPVEEATVGQSIGIKVPEAVREGDEVFLVQE
jgi:translation initiation factor IF-2